MTKKLFALIIAASLLALPITAQDGEKTSHDITTQAETRGFKNGVAATLAASSLAMLAYMGSTIKKGLFIPAGINCRAVPDGYRTVYYGTCSPTNKFCSPFPMTEQKFKTVCDENPLFNAMSDVSGEISLQGASIHPNSFEAILDNNYSAQTMLEERIREGSIKPRIFSASIDVKENMIEKIGDFPNKVAFVCTATLIGAFIYYLSLDYKPTQPADATKQNSLQHPDSIAPEQVQAS